MGGRGGRGGVREAEGVGASARREEVVGVTLTTGAAAHAGAAEHPLEVLHDEGDEGSRGR